MRDIASHRGLNLHSDRVLLALDKMVNIVNMISIVIVEALQHEIAIVRDCREAVVKLCLEERVLAVHDVVRVALLFFEFR